MVGNVLCFHRFVLSPKSECRYLKPIEHNSGTQTIWQDMIPLVDCFYDNLRSRKTSVIGFLFHGRAESETSFPPLAS